MPTGQRIGWEVARADPLKISRQALGKLEEMQQNSAPDHSPAPRTVESDPGQASRAVERSCGDRVLGKTLHSTPQRDGKRAALGKRALCPPSTARTRLGETLGLGDGAACRAVG